MRQSVDHRAALPHTHPKKLVVLPAPFVGDVLLPFQFVDDGSADAAPFHRPRRRDDDVRRRASGHYRYPSASDGPSADRGPQ
jgi:hypothetical protein